MITARKTKVKASRMWSEEIELDPSLAQDFLDNRNTRNRPVSKAVVNRYAEAMKSGKWKLIPHGIAIDTNGALVDGQHRLMAVAISGVTVPMQVTWDVDPETFFVIDTGKTRSNSDIIGIHEPNYCKEIAGALGLLKKHLDGTLHWRNSSRTSNLDANVMYAKYPRITEGIPWIARLKHVGCVGSLTLFLWYALSEKDEEAAGAFLSKLATGADLEEHHPILVLRNRIINDRMTRISRPKEELVALTFKAWNLWRKGEKVQVLKLATLINKESGKAVLSVPKLR